MNIFVTGASGYIGRQVVERLLADGLEVTGLARSEESARRIEALGAKSCRGDLTQPGEWMPQTHGSAAVVHIALAGAEADRKLVPMLIDALAGTDKPFVYTSGVWVMGSTGDRLAGESWPLRPPPISAWRQDIERQVVDARERKVCSVVLRPATVYGLPGGIVYRMVEAALGPEGKGGGVVRVPGDGLNRKSYVHIEDLADLYLAALNHAGPGELFVAADGPALVTREVAEAAAQAGGGRVEYISPEQARAEMGPVADAYLLDQKIGSTKAGRQLGWKPLRPGVLDWLRGLKLPHA